MKKLESIKELREICQPKYEQVKFNSYYRIYRRFFRIFSIYLTKLLLYFNTSANFISIFGLLLGIVGSLYFYFGKFIVGSIILQFWFLMDTLDGELARYYYSKNKQKNKLIRGEFWDLNFHHLVHSLVFIGLIIGLFDMTNDINMVYLGIAALTSLLINELIDLNKIKVLFYENKKIKSTSNKKISISKKLMFLYTFPSIINLIFLASIFNKVTLVLYFYGITFPLIVLTKFIINDFIRKW